MWSLLSLCTRPPLLLCLWTPTQTFAGWSPMNSNFLTSVFVHSFLVSILCPVLQNVFLCSHYFSASCAIQLFTGGNMQKFLSADFSPCLPFQISEIMAHNSCRYCALCKSSVPFCVSLFHVTSLLHYFFRYRL